MSLPPPQSLLIMHTYLYECTCKSCVKLIKPYNYIFCLPFKAIRQITNLACNPIRYFVNIIIYHVKRSTQQKSQFPHVRNCINVYFTTKCPCLFSLSLKFIHKLVYAKTFFSIRREFTLLARVHMKHTPESFRFTFHSCLCTTKREANMWFFSVCLCSLLLQAALLMLTKEH